MTQSHNQDDPTLKVNLPYKLDRILRQNLQPDDTVFVALRGAFLEALICTDRRVLIIKTGYQTGHIFGNNVFQLPYATITGAQVNAHLQTGYFELSAGGIQNTPMSYWQDTLNSFSQRKGTTTRSPQRSPHCVSLVKKQFQAFRTASAFIMQQAELARSPAPQQAPTDGIALIEQLSKLHDAGILTLAEFEEKKAAILARL
jgi:hypothetical protein